LKTEVRYLSTPNLEIRSEDGAPTRITGYAVVYNALSHDLGGFREVIRPGTFTRSLTDNPDVRALVEHNDLMLVGRTTAGTLKITEDERGLAIELTAPNTTVGRDLVENVRLKNYSGMSFRFNTVKDNWNRSADGVVRELTDVDLIEVSVVSTPAYPDTSVAIRSMKAWSDFDPSMLKTLEYKLKLACL
jgi:HK97 family phage prohead protease